MSIDHYLNRGFRWLTRKQDELAATDALYSNGLSTVPIRAVVGKTSQNVLSVQETAVASVYFDFIIESKYLTDQPRTGDRITCDGKTFEVVSQLDGRCYLIVDSTFETLRVHTQLLNQ